MTAMRPRAPRPAPRASVALDLQLALHAEERVRIALEVVMAGLEGDLEVVRLTRDLQHVARGGETGFARVGVGEEVHVVHTRLERESQHVAAMGFDLCR